MIALTAAATGCAFGQADAEWDRTAFALDLYRAAVPADVGNAALSPSSVATILALTQAGARGDTAIEMARALRLPGDPAAITRVFRELQSTLAATDARGSVRLRSANSLWPKAGYELRPEFLTTARTDYGATVEPITINGDGVARINGWVAEQTAGKIRQLFDALPPLTRLVLVNTVYFKGDWAIAFETARTRPAPFHAAGGPVEVPTMSASGRHGYAEMAGFQALELAYKDPDVAMWVLLPTARDGLAALERSLTSAQIAELRTALRQKQQVDVQLPRFAVGLKTNLNEPLKGLGMRKAFAPETADFSGMAERPGDLYVGLVVHQAVVEVNEEGTEAAAATGVVMVTRAMPQRPKAFVADHPFLFLIVERVHGTILFMGRVANPLR